MGEIKHNSVSINGLNMHVAEDGEGPIILFIHGFPECWYTWRHQITYFAAAGFRVLAPDMRGYADTTGASTADLDQFTTLHVAGDLAALIDAVAPNEQVFVVGHDWGSALGWGLCLERPDKVKAYVSMSVAFNRRNPDRKPVETLRAVYGDEYYMIRFQEAGEIEKEFGQVGTKNVLKHMLTYRTPAPFFLPKGRIFPDPVPSLPWWLSEEDIDFYTQKYDATGFTGALDYYRALDKNWEATAAWTGAQVKVPVKFIVGDLDLTYNSPGAKEYIHNGGFKADVPLLKEVVVLKDVAHFLHEEKPDEVNKHIQSFFNSFST